MIRRHLYISGRVQGVFFRASTRQQAESLGIEGWVRNLRDGRVEAVFEGPEEKVTRIVDWCHAGPRRASVENVEVEEEEPTGNFEGFEVRR